MDQPKDSRPSQPTFSGNNPGTTTGPPSQPPSLFRRSMFRSAGLHIQWVYGVTHMLTCLGTSNRHYTHMYTHTLVPLSKPRVNSVPQPTASPQAKLLRVLRLRVPVPVRAYPVQASEPCTVFWLFEWRFLLLLQGSRTAYAKYE